MRLDPIRFLRPFAALALLSWTPCANGAPVVWNQPAGGLWREATNWSPMVVPGTGDEVFITLDGTYTVTLDSTVIGVQALALGAASGTQTLFGRDAELSVAGGFIVEANGKVDLQMFTLTSATFENHGEVVLGSPVYALYGATTNGPLENHGTLTKNPVSTLNGPIENYGKLVLQGTTAADSTLVNHPGAILRIEGTPTTVAVLELGDTYTNGGMLDLACALGLGNVTLRMTSTSPGRSTLVNAPGATMRSFPAGLRSIDGQLDNRGMLDVLSTLTMTRPNATHVNTGTLALTDANLTVSGAGASFSNRGTLAIGAGRTFTQTAGTFTNDTAGVVSGSGTFNASTIAAVQRGHIAPGSPIGRIRFTGSLTVDSLGSVDIQLAGTTPGSGHDVLNVEDFLLPAGVLRVSLASGYTPQSGDRFDVIEYGDRVGRFRRIDGLDLAGGLALRPEYGASGLSLVCFEGQVAEVSPITGRRVALAFGRAPHPCPGPGRAEFSIIIASMQHIHVNVSDVSGRVVATLHRGALAAGEHEFVWSGRGVEGAPVPAGLYFISARGTGLGVTKKLLVTR